MSGLGEGRGPRERAGEGAAARVSTGGGGRASEQGRERLCECPDRPDWDNTQQIDREAPAYNYSMLYGFLQLTPYPHRDIVPSGTLTALSPQCWSMVRSLVRGVL